MEIRSPLTPASTVLLRWLCLEGLRVESGRPIATLISPQGLLDVAVPCDVRINELLIAEGDPVEGGTSIALVAPVD
ncbi:MAG: hypothetical protein ACKVX7_02440 [Planctomycetota bacterium]